MVLGFELRACHLLDILPLEPLCQPIIEYLTVIGSKIQVKFYVEQIAYSVLVGLDRNPCLLLYLGLDDFKIK
jgi:hypothetical protein